MDNQEPLNLSALGMDLAASLLPDWAKESSFQSPTERTPEPAKRERKGFSFPREGREVTSPKSHQKSRFASRRRAESDQEGFGKERRRTQDGQPRKDDRRVSSDGHPSDREEILGAELPGWQITFLPDPRGVEGLAAQIRATARAYPVFEIAKLVLESPRRYDVKFAPKSDASSVPPLFQFGIDKTLWMSEADAIRHALRSAREIFYRKEEVEVEPPKGNFQCIAEVDGVLLCPPNYHEYPEKLRVLHEQKYAKMPFQAFKARVRMLRDEQALEQWRKSASKRVVFRPLPIDAVKASLSGESTKPVPSHSDQPTQSGAEEAVVPTGAESPDENSGDAQVVPEIVPSGDGSNQVAPGAPANEPKGEPLADDIEQKGSAESDGANADVQVAFESPAPENSAEPAITNESDLFEHFRKSFAQLAIQHVTSESVIPGTVAELSSCTEISRAVRAARLKLKKFPLQLAQMLARNISTHGLPVFKAHRKILYVSIARPKPIDPAQVGEPLRKLLELLEKNPRTPRNELMKILIESRPIPEGSDAAAREAAVRADLAWLIREGHVVDYAMRGIQVIKAKSAGTSSSKNAKVEASDASEKSRVPGEAHPGETKDAGPDSVVPTATAGSAITGEETDAAGETGSLAETFTNSEEGVGIEGTSSGGQQLLSDESNDSFETVTPVVFPKEVPYPRESLVLEQKDNPLDSASTKANESLIEPSAAEQMDDMHTIPASGTDSLATDSTPESAISNSADSESSISAACLIEHSEPASSSDEQSMSEGTSACATQSNAEAVAAKASGDSTDTENRASGVLPGNS